MKEKLIYALSAFFLVALMGAPMLCAEEDFGEVFVQDDENDSDPSAFEGDSESMPGERAPESLPMDDAPGLIGVGIE